jgi:hypothetical protein
MNYTARGRYAENPSARYFSLFASFYFGGRLVHFCPGMVNRAYLEHCAVEIERIR